MKRNVRQCEEQCLISTELPSLNQPGLKTAWFWAIGVVLKPWPGRQIGRMKSEIDRIIFQFKPWKKLFYCSAQTLCCSFQRVCKVVSSVSEQGSASLEKNPKALKKPCNASLFPLTYYILWVSQCFTAVTHNGNIFVCIVYLHFWLHKYTAR